MPPPAKKPNVRKTLNTTTFLLNDFVVTSPNAEPLTAFPPTEAVTYDDPDPDKTFSLNWFVPEYPQISFVLSPP